jgi:hypothetical protein
MVWCSQLLQAVVAGMEKIVEQGAAEGRVDTARLFAVKARHRPNVTWPLALPQVQYLLAKNQTSSSTAAAARLADRAYVHSVTGSLPMDASLDYVTRHWFLVVTLYVSIASLVHMRHYFNCLTGQATTSYPSPWTSVSPPQHLFVYSVYAPIAHLMCLLVGYKAFKHSMHAIAALLSALVAWLLYRAYRDASDDPALFIETYSFISTWIAAYGCALALRVVLLIAIQSTRQAVAVLTQLGRTVLRWTVWTRPVRRAFRGPLKPLTTVALRVVDYVTAYAFYLTAAIVIVTVRTLGDASSQSIVSFSINICLLSLYALTAAAYAYNVIAIPLSTSSSTNSEESFKQLDSLLLCWPIFFTTIAPVHQAYRDCLGLDKSGITVAFTNLALGTYALECMVVLGLVLRYLQDRGGG